MVVRVYWHSEADGPHGANVLVADSARGDVQLWLRERCSGSVVSWGPIDGGRRIELWLSASVWVAAALNDRVDEFKFRLPGEEEGTWWTVNFEQFLARFPPMG